MLAEAVIILSVSFGTYTASYPVGITGRFPRLSCRPYSWPLTSAKVENVYRCTSMSSDTSTIRRIGIDRTSHLHNLTVSSPKLDLVTQPRWQHTNRYAKIILKHRQHHKHANTNISN
jgi:hypothetical protein